MNEVIISSCSRTTNKGIPRAHLQHLPLSRKRRELQKDTPGRQPYVPVINDEGGYYKSVQLCGGTSSMCLWRRQLTTVRAGFF